MRVEHRLTDARLWDRYVTQHPDGSLYHLHRWARLLPRLTGHRWHGLAAFQDDRLVGVLPLVYMRSLLFGRLLVSMPYFNYGGILADHPEAARLLYEAAADLARRWGVPAVELRHARPVLSDVPTRRHKVAMHLALPPDPEGLWQALKPKVRNQVRKAQKAGLVVRHGRADLLDDFYRVFARNMRDLGTPVYGRRFFAGILGAWARRSRLLAVFLPDGTTCVAAGFLLGFRGRLEIPWASSRRDFNHLCPNNLLYWSALEMACREGYRVFDFGRSSPDSGTYQFKRQWGAQPLPLHWQYWLAPGRPMPDLRPDSPAYQRKVALWKRTPVWLTRLVGPHIVNNIP